MKIYISRPTNLDEDSVVEAAKAVFKIMVDNGVPKESIKIKWWKPGTKYVSLIDDADVVFFIKNVWRDCIVGRGQYKEHISCIKKKIPHFALYHRNSDIKWHVYITASMDRTARDDYGYWALFRTCGSNINDTIKEYIPFEKYITPTMGTRRDVQVNITMPPPEPISLQVESDHSLLILLHK